MKKVDIIFIILLVSFIVITFFVINDNTLVLDTNIYNFISSFKTKNLTSFFKFITEFADIKIICILLILFFIFIKNKIMILIPTIIGINVEILNLVLKFIFKRERPTVFIHLVNVVNYSYPSAHAMISMAIYGSFIYLVWNYFNNKKIKIIITIILGGLIFLIGLSRIYLGVHYFTDIISGYIVSSCYLIIFDKVVRKWGLLKCKS